MTVAIVGCWLLSANQYRRLGNDIAAGAGFVLNLWFYATLSDRTQTPDFLVTHLWTLGIQEQFYIFWPMLLWLTWRFAKQWFALAIAALSVLSLASFVSTSAANPSAAWLMPWNRLWELALGGALAYILLVRSMNPAKPSTGNAALFYSFGTIPSRALLGGLGALCLSLSILGLVPPSWPPIYPVLMALSTAMLIYAGPQCWFNRCVLSARPMVFIGLLSYPLYLWHVSLFVLLPILLGQMRMSEFQNVPPSMKISATAVSLALSFITYKYLELPIQAISRTKLVAGLLCAAMASTGAVVFLASR